MARFLSEGLTALPPYTYIGIIAGIFLGILLSILEKTKIKRYTPSPFGIGIAMFFPGYYTIPIFFGSIVKLILEKIFPNWMESYETSVASGFIVGESIIGVIVAILMVSGII